MPAQAGIQYTPTYKWRTTLSCTWFGDYWIARLRGR
jgi:hypothetical protein